MITYLLSVGDRHLDNLLLTEWGHLIHIDFGYILGRDPKIFPPPMRLSKEMVCILYCNYKGCSHYYYYYYYYRLTQWEGPQVKSSLNLGNIVIMPF